MIKMINNKIKVCGDGPRSSFSMDLYNSCDRWDSVIWQFEYLFGWKPIFEYFKGYLGYLGSIAVVSISLAPHNSWKAQCRPNIPNLFSHWGINVNFAIDSIICQNILEIFPSKLTTNCLFEPLCPFQSLLHAIENIKE